MRIIIGVNNSVVHFNFHLIGSNHSCKLCLLFTWLGKKTYRCIITSFAHGMEATSIYYDLFLILCLVQGSNLKESEHELDLLDMFEWVQSYVQTEVVNATTVRFSVYKMIQKNCSSTNTVSFCREEPVLCWFCDGKIVKCRKMTTCLLIPNCLIWGGGVPCLSYFRISTQCSILLS